MKAAAEVVVDAAAGHPVERQAGHVQRLVVAEALASRAAAGAFPSGAETWGRAEAAVVRVEGRRSRGDRLRSRSGTQVALPLARLPSPRGRCSVMSPADVSRSRRGGLARLRPGPSAAGGKPGRP